MCHKIIPAFLIILLSFSNSFSQQFENEKILADLAYLNTSIKNAHYNIYSYTSKEKIDPTYNKLKASIDKDSLSLLETTNIFQKLVSTVKNGHTEIDFPINSYKEYAYNNGTLFPIEIAFEEGKCFIRKNFSENTDIKVGSEILKINGISMKDILSKIYPQISAERIYLKNAKIEVYSFPRLYWQVFGKQDLFEVEIRNGEIINKFSIKAVNLIDGYEKKRTEVLNAQMSFKHFESSSYLCPLNTLNHLVTLALVILVAMKKLIKNLLILHLYK